ncbi:RSP_2647 family RNA methyltransferase [Aliiroseovarius sp. PTFE2010]|uniref:RSP_2647 family RNA methyltransferase n=1 Tax=Aliiroseovarius sp. PTFE2010 TaxID=3417190 RepID=UPI003CEFA8DA
MSSPDPTAPHYPVVRLIPKANARAIRHGFPWAYANEVVTDRRTRALPAGTIAELQDAERSPMGLVAVNPNSKIFCRMLTRDTSARIDRTWLTARLQAAQDHRARLFADPFYRLVHAEADGLAGVVIDRFGDTAVVQPNAAWADVLFDDLAAALVDVTGVSCVIKNASGRARSLEGLDDITQVAIGSAPGIVAVPMNGAIYMADLLEGQKTGLFFDQRPNHAFAQQLANGGQVLDVFSHVGGFSLAMLAGGATGALAVDSAAPALELAAKGAAAMGRSDALATRRGDAFDVLTALAGEGAQFDVVVCDPPAFAPAKPALDRGLRAYERLARLAAPLVKPGGYLGLCSCSHAADLTRFRAACNAGIGKAGRHAQIVHTGFAGPDHPLMPGLAESGYLKALFYRLMA